MGTLKFNNLTFIYGCHILPPKGYSAITLFGYVFTRKSKDALTTYLATDRGKVWAHHEAMHVYQSKTFKHFKWIKFYFKYLCQFFKAWPFHMNWHQAYRTICFELEAYIEQDYLDVTESNWKNYILSIEDRKNLNWLDYYMNIKINEHGTYFI